MPAPGLLYFGPVSWPSFEALAQNCSPAKAEEGEEIQVAGS